MNKPFSPSRLFRHLMPAIVALFYSIALSAAKTADFAHLVNTLIGSGTTHGLASGYICPGATYPHGMVQFTPTYFEKNSGFVANQYSGGGCYNLGNFPMFPLKGELTKSPNDIRSAHYTVSDEKGHAGYYQAKVNGDVLAELTVAERSGMGRFTFPSDAEKGTVIIGSGLASTPIYQAAVAMTDANHFEGYATGGSFCGQAYPTPYKVYIVGEFNVASSQRGIWREDKVIAGSNFVEGPRSGFWFTFDTKQQKTLLYRFALSYVSIENARENLKADNLGWDFDQVVTRAERKWNDYLGRIEVDGENKSRITQFYTHLYHALIHPSLASDVNGEYMGADEKVHKSRSRQYTGFSNWDTYRTQTQLLVMLEPDVAADIAQSHIDFAEQGGGSFPRWVVANWETNIMEGDPSSIIVANTWIWGARNFDKEAAIKVMRKGAEVPGAKCQKFETRPGLKDYLETGNLDASRQLEFMSADFAIARFALEALDDKELSDKYMERTRFWKRLYNPQTRWIQSRDKNGNWKSLDEGFMEATYKDFFWMVPYNINGLIETIGGRDSAEVRLQEYFRRLDADYGDDWYASGNEPCFGFPWIYNWVGSPWKTQDVIRRVLNEIYIDVSDGLPGNDDLGAMGAWYVWVSLGLYPEIPGVAGFALSTPSFPRICIHLPNGKDIVQTSSQDGKPFIKSLNINGKECKGTWLPWKDLADGAIMKYATSDKPNTKWGTQIAPPSYK